MSLSIHGILYAFFHLICFVLFSIQLLLLLDANKVRCDAKHVKKDEKNLNFYYVRFCIGF